MKEHEKCQAVINRFKKRIKLLTNRLVVLTSNVQEAEKRLLILKATLEAGDNEVERRKNENPSDNDSSSLTN